jgi:amidohydrolase
MYRSFIFILLLTTVWSCTKKNVYGLVDDQVKQLDPKLIEWRRHLHQNPELSNREYNTMKYIEQNLQNLGLTIRTGVAKTGVVALLDTKKPGPTIGLRADIDALPVLERGNLSFKSSATSEYLGNKVPVMHACGHDAHTAILLATANVLSKMKDRLTGKIVFVFQPAEEGAPRGEEGGAALMVKEGLIKDYGIEAMFGLHMAAALDANKINYKVGGTMAAENEFEVIVKGKQAHGSEPWGGIDPIATSALIINGLQTVISRHADLTKEAAVVSVGKISGGVRNNIIPEQCKFSGTIRTLDIDMQKEIHQKMRQIITSIAASQGAVAEVNIYDGYPITYNDPVLTRSNISTLERVAGENNVRVTVASTGAEDFSYFAQQVPSFFFFLGGKNPKDDNLLAQQHHTPEFYLDESGFGLGVRAFCNLVLDYASNKSKKIN